MPKVRILSDLHLEFGPLDLTPAGEDVIVLAGDIDLYRGGVNWADDVARQLGVPVVVIAGNHEFYRGALLPTPTYHTTLAALFDAARTTEGRVSFLENSEVVRAGVRFIGATLWTDFFLYGEPMKAMRLAQKNMNDYRAIRWNEKQRITPEDVLAIHNISRDYIEVALKVPHDGPTIVVTHMAPSCRSIHPGYRESDINPAYASNLDKLVEHSGAALWIHGHTHTSFDYEIGRTRVVCNPRGYVRWEVNPDFNPNLVVEV